MLTFVAQDHPSTEMIEVNADVPKATQAREVVAFADWWKAGDRRRAGLVVFDSRY